jgi:hypothetical protein
LTGSVVGRVLLAFSGARGEEFSKIRQRGYLVDQGREPYTASILKCGCILCLLADKSEYGGLNVARA